MFKKRALTCLLLLTLTVNAQEDSTSKADKKLLENLLLTATIRLQIDKPDSSFTYYASINGYINKNLKIAVATRALPINLEKLKKDIKPKTKNFYTDEEITFIDSFTTTKYKQSMFYTIYETQDEITITAAAITNAEYLLTATANYPKLLDKAWREKLLRICATVRD